MKKQNFSQLELFSQSKEYNQTKTDVSNKFLSYIWRYEKTILIIIGLIVTGIVSFSLGVEKGKRLMALKSNYNLDIAAKIQPSEPVQTTSQTIQKQDQDTVKLIKEDIQNYTIQVASYQTKTRAQTEAEALRKKGYSSVVLPKGKYTVVYVGKFSNKETARSLLSELKNRYQDCFIRRL